MFRKLFSKQQIKAGIYTKLTLFSCMILGTFSNVQAQENISEQKSSKVAFQAAKAILQSEKVILQQSRQELALLRAKLQVTMQEHKNRPAHVVGDPQKHEAIRQEIQKKRDQLLIKRQEFLEKRVALQTERYKLQAERQLINANKLKSLSDKATP